MNEKETIEDRIEVLRSAIIYYKKCFTPVPQKWIDELKGLRDSLTTPPATGKEVTAMQELLVWVVENKEMFTPAAMILTVSKIMDFKAKEKQQITEAFTSGQANIADIFFDEDGLNYFTTTYKQS